MKCAICGTMIDSIDEAINAGWIPYVWDADQEKEGPFCASCSESLIQIDKDGEFVVKEEFHGKIQYQGGDFACQVQEEDLVIEIFMTEERKQSH
jgi:hypothetical protein